MRWRVKEVWEKDKWKGENEGSERRGRCKGVRGKLKGRIGGIERGSLKQGKEGRDKGMERESLKQGKGGRDKGMERGSLKQGKEGRDKGMERESLKQGKWEG